LWFGKNRSFLTDRFLSNIKGRIGPYVRYGSSEKVIMQSRSKISSTPAAFHLQTQTPTSSLDRMGPGFWIALSMVWKTFRIAVIRSQYARFDEVWF
jgi:hypothetical protein